MEKLFEMLERGEMPSFLEVLTALDDISDIDWEAIEASQLSIRDVFEGHRVVEDPLFRSGQFCESCD